MRFVVDRIEENFAVCINEENDDIMNFNLENIPFIVEEGDVIIYENGAWNKGEINQDFHDSIKQKMDDLWN